MRAYRYARTLCGLPAFRPFKGEAGLIAEGLYGAAEGPIAPGPPYRVIHHRVRVYNCVIEPALDAYKTADGETYGFAIRRAMWQMGLVCGLQWRQVQDLRKAHFAFYLRNGYDIARQTGHSGYVGAWVGKRDILLGDRLKPAFGERRPTSINVARFAMHGWQMANGLATYDSGAGTHGMSDAAFSHPIQPTNYGWAPHERQGMTRHFGPPWLAK